MGHYCKHLKSVVFFLVLLAEAEATSAQTAVYDAHFGAVTGSSEVVGLGGAYRAAAHSIAAAPLNPSGLSLMPSWWSGSFSYGSFTQRSRMLPFENPSQREQIDYFDAGLGFKVRSWKDFAFGIYFHAPFSTKIQERNVRSNSGSLEDIEYEFVNFNLGLPFSIRWTEKLTTGVSFKLTSAETKFKTSNRSANKGALGAGFDLGITYLHDERNHFALVYHLGQDLGLKNKLDSSVDHFEVFREARTPHRLYVGYARHLNPRFQLLMDWGVIFPLHNAIRPGTGISESLEEVASGNKPSFPYHIGLKFLVVPGKWEARVGHYWQPARTSGEIQRFHITGGLDYFFWYVKLGSSFDVADDYFNFGFSIGPSFSHRERT